MNLLNGTSCKPCIERHIGPALDKIWRRDTVDYCGGCGEVVEKFVFTYWCPWPDEEAPVIMTADQIDRLHASHRIRHWGDEVRRLSQELNIALANAQQAAAGYERLLEEDQ